MSNIDDTRKRLLSLSGELLSTERKMMNSAELAPENSSSRSAKYAALEAKKPKSGVVKWIILSVVFLIVFTPLALYGIYRIYKAAKEYKENQQSWQNQRQALDDSVAELSALSARRQQLLDELNSLIRDNPQLDGDYWWKGGISPLEPCITRGPGGVLLEKPDWDFIYLNSYAIAEVNGEMYLRDMQETITSIPHDVIMDALNSGSYTILYQNSNAMSLPGDFYSGGIFAYSVTRRTKMVSHTTRKRIDKDVMMREYQSKLDSHEIVFNAFTENALMTNDDMNLSGRRSNMDWVHEKSFRDNLELDYQRKLNGMSDYEEHTTYSRETTGQFDVELYSCAEVLKKVDSNDNVVTAAILVANVPQNVIRLTLLPKEKNNPFEGLILNLDSYPLEPNIKPSIAMAVDLLFGPKTKQSFGLKERDILSERPKGMTSEEFTYLMLHDK